MHDRWDLLILGGELFDGRGVPPLRADVAVHKGRIAAIGAQLDPQRADRVIDATGCWVTPGLLDIHTHLDLEAELAPGLTEVVRHGTTAVILGNCSLGLAFGHQRHTGHDPIVSCFARVENLPKRVLRAAADRATWREPASYLDHLDTLPLGPHVAPLLPHSMLRVEVMGMPDAIEREATAEELRRMKAVLDEALRAGFVGLSTDALPFHYLADDPHRREKIPTQHASFAELRALTDVVRARGRIWQTTPPKDKPLASLRNFLLTSGTLFGAPLRVTAVAAMDVVPNRSLLRMARLVVSLLNSRLFGGHLRMQSLAARFKVWADGPITPLAEESEPLRRLNEPDLEDREARRAVLDDPDWQASFRRWWTAGYRLGSLAWLKRLLRVEDDQLPKRFDALFVERCAVTAWRGLSFAQVHERVRSVQAGARQDAEHAELTIVRALPHPCDEVDLWIGLLRAFDTDMTWWCVSANPTQAAVDAVLFDERFLPGFADSGAHLTNMAFYDVNLRALQAAQRRGSAAVARMVQRLTAEPAELFGLDIGLLEPGSRADLAVIDPTALAAYEPESNVTRLHRADLGQDQLVNRSDGVVRWVVIGGEVAWSDDAASPTLGQRALGTCLRPTRGGPAHTPA
jgi:N-acyl-D-aspartate/D-glutamate deacylase